MIGDRIDKYGKIHTNKNIVPGKCIFPFKYKKKSYNNCVVGETGDWCATKITSRGYTQKWAYCNNKNIIIKKKKIFKKKTLKKKTKKLNANTFNINKNNSDMQVAIENMSNKNELIVRELTTMKKKVQAKREFFKVRVYNTAIKIIEDDFKNIPITSGAQLKPFKGVGNKIVEKIDEILKTGKLLAAEKVREDPKIEFIHNLQKVYGIGPSKANDLVNKYNITNIEDLRKRKHEKGENGRDILDDVKKKGLKYYEDILKRIPRGEMVLHNNFIKKCVEKLNTEHNLQIEYIVAGSFRRGDESSGDIDVLITSKLNNKKVFNMLIKELNDKKYMQDELVHGTKKFHGMCKLPRKMYSRRIDIMYTTPLEYPFAILYFTGSGSFNPLMRSYCLSKGYRLNEYGLFKFDQKFYKENKKIKKIGDGVKVSIEEDIFMFLGIPYIEPKNRSKDNLQKILNSIKE